MLDSLLSINAPSWLARHLLPALVFLSASYAVLWSFDTPARRRSRIVRERLKEIEPSGKALPWSWGRLWSWLPAGRAATRAAQPNMSSDIAPVNAGARSVVHDRLVHAGVRSPGAVREFLIVQISLALLPTMICLVAWTFGVVPFLWVLAVGTGLGLIGFVAPNLWLMRRVVRRRIRLRNSFVDFLDLFAACAGSGMSVHEMIKVVPQEMQSVHPELAAEFAVCCQQMQFGQSLDAAISDLVTRTGVDELRAFHVILRQSTKVGCAIGDAFLELAGSLRRNRELRAEEQAQKASVKILLPTMLFIFPAVFVVLAAPAAIEITEMMSEAPRADQGADKQQ